MGCGSSTPENNEKALIVSFGDQRKVQKTPCEPPQVRAEELDVKRTESPTCGQPIRQESPTEVPQEDRREINIESSPNVNSEPKSQSDNQTMAAGSLEAKDVVVRVDDT